MRYGTLRASLTELATWRAISQGSNAARKAERQKREQEQRESDEQLRDAATTGV
jgi:hypothetical protein